METRQQHQNFPMYGKPLQNKYQCQKKEINPKEQDCESESGIQVGKFCRKTILVRSYEIEKL